METIFKHLITSAATTLFAVVCAAQTPTIAPTATYTATSTSGEQTETTMYPGESYSGSAPLPVRFEAHPSDVGGWTENYEWRFYTESDMKNPYLIRYEQDTEYTFTTAGAHKIVCYAIFTNGDERVEYTQEYWSREVSPFHISISESILEMPNAFSPNGDGINDIYCAKPGYKSIVEFHAIIFNRWGVKLYEWNDPAGGWDGKYKGKDMPDGTYFVLVKAKGADGRDFKIKRDVNLLRGFTESTTVATQ